ncbi:MAG: hypothetical protein A2172_03130 [Candidatus Woykebacteria bacterium RBG_13_40_15]|uniref:HD domain-containing protein n=1 Tax=Candidatus Woykebacteria bacterium RBG_13_40_15 TaxID=1802593 RepID=A0A1G1W5E6_9BACT|nr:MAG: hypothetical protein A2172_03130 [Candidatus Woykebacteria bacterium RBG_13_40_15]
MTIRSGWPDRDVQTRFESSLEHSASLFFFGFFDNLSRGLELDLAKLAIKAIAHDLHEILTTDRNPAQVYSKGRTRAQIRRFWERARERVKDWRDWETLFFAEEKRAMWKLTRPLSRKVRNVLREAWVEYYEGKTREDRYLREIHPLVGASWGLFCREQPGNEGMASLNSFFAEGDQIITDLYLRKLLLEVQEKVRKAFGAKNN